MTHSYQYKSNLPLSRRKMNARFVGKLKNLCGGIYGLHVYEHFSNDADARDYAYIFIPKSNPNARAIKSRVLNLCKNYGIGKDFVEVLEGENGANFDVEGEYINIYLSEPCN